MKLSKRTLEILKNFASINPSLYVEAGSKLYTIAPNTSLCAEAEAEETFETSFCIYELSKFLATVSLFPSPEFEFNEKCVTIFGNKSKLNYHYCETKSIDELVKRYGLKPKTNQITYKFDLTSDQLQSLIRASSVLELKSLKVCAGEDGGVDISVMDPKNQKQNTFVINDPNGKVIGDDPAAAFIKTDKLVILPGDYSVEMTKSLACKWSNKSININYYIAQSTLTGKE
jgi:hypothetical protein